MLKVVVGSDHRGHSAKESLIAFLGELGHEVYDAGTDGTGSCDYPDIAYPAAKMVANGEVERGILIDGHGIGMCISANKVPAIRAAMCYDELTANLSRRHNDANVLCLASDVLGEELMRRIVASWMAAEFESTGRHQRRVEKINRIEAGQSPTE